MTDGYTQGRRWTPLLHSILLTLFPVLYLLSENIYLVRARAALLPALTVLILCSFIVALAAASLRSVERGAIVASVAMLSILSYGFVLAGLERATVFGIGIGQHRHSMALLAFFVFGSWAIARLASQKLVEALTTTLLIAGVVLVMQPLYRVLSVELIDRGAEDPSARASAESRRTSINAVPREGLPDIYYFVFDRYPDPHTLYKRFGLDNSPFLSSLDSLGFFVADSSRTNYPATFLSLASSLNMEYVDKLIQPEDRDSADESLMYPLIEENRVWRTLREFGYEFVHVGTFWGPTTHNRFADININLFATPIEGDFARLLYGQTLFYGLQKTIFYEQFGDLRREKWNRILFEIERIREIPSIPGPTFTFAHFLMPHAPYVFDRDGEYVSDAEEKGNGWDPGFVEMTLFANRMILDLAGEILDRSTQDPIIVLQADEGPVSVRIIGKSPGFDWRQATAEELRQKLGILNAIYAPKARDSFRATMTPVNTFRALFRAYLGMEIHALPDRSYVFPFRSRPYELVDVRTLDAWEE